MVNILNRQDIMMYDNVHDVNFRQILSSDLYDVLEIQTLYNKNIYCTTSIIFELCCREFRSIIGSKTFLCSENTNLKRLIGFIKQLSLHGSFSRHKFRTLCHELILKDQINIEILLWLDQNNLIFFEDYWATKQSAQIISELKELIADYVDNLSHTENTQIECAVRSIFLKLLLAINSQTFTPWFTRIRSIFEEYLDEVVDELAFNLNKAKLLGFIKVFSNVDVCYGNLVKNTCKNIIQRLMSYQDKEKFTIYDALQHQEQWMTKNVESNSLELYFELLKRFSLDEILEIIQEVPDDKLNFRLVLTSIAVFVNKVPDSYKQLKSTVHRNLQSVFTDKSISLLHISFPEISQILFPICLIRQSCLEHDTPEASYTEWFTFTLGCDSVLRCGTSARPWALLLGALAAALPYEPTWVLKVHATRALRAPTGCNKEAQGYKEACKTKLTKVDCNTNTDSEDFCN